jgi:hypothetical protein
MSGRQSADQLNCPKCKAPLPNDGSCCDNCDWVQLSKRLACMRCEDPLPMHTALPELRVGRETLPRETLLHGCLCRDCLDALVVFIRLGVSVKRAEVFNTSHGGHPPHPPSLSASEWARENKLSNRAQNTVDALRVGTVGGLANVVRRTMYNVRNAGTATRREIAVALRRDGYIPLWDLQAENSLTRGRPGR